jgi:hypothetical protein
MTTYSWPSGRSFVPQRSNLRILNNGRENASPATGASQTVTQPGSKWGWSIVMKAMSVADREDFEGFLVGLSGREHRISTHDWKHPTPRGNCNLTGVTLAASAAQFATSVQLTGCGAAKTLKRGDWFGFSTGQLVRVIADATADGSGVMTVNFRHSLRAAISSGAAVTLDRPTALYILTDAALEFPRRPGRAEESFGFDLVEVFS